MFSWDVCVFVFSCEHQSKDFEDGWFFWGVRGGGGGGGDFFGWYDGKRRDSQAEGDPSPRGQEVRNEGGKESRTVRR